MGIVIVLLHFLSTELFGFLLLFALAPEDDAQTNEEGDDCHGNDDGDGSRGACA